MAHRIEVAFKKEEFDSPGRATARRIRDELGIFVNRVRTIEVYTLDAALSPGDLERIGLGPCSDPVIQTAAVDRPVMQDGFDWAVEIGFRPGVTDNVGRTAREAAQLLLKDRFGEASIYTSRQYLISGNLAKSDVERIAEDLLANNLIQRWEILDCRSYRDQGGFRTYLPVVTDSGDGRGKVETIGLDLPDPDLERLSRDRVLVLSLEEMKAIRSHFADPKVIRDRARHGLSPEPTDVEIECLAQTWSEHCKHKIFNARITYIDETGEAKVIDSLFASTIRRATTEVRKRLGDRDFCKSVFVDNAGVIAFDDEWNIAFKVETHNSPSALDPYGGALTGIVGVNRDSFGTGLGARLFCNTDVFCLASPFREGELPPRILHPRRILEGVRLGVEHGGNKSGIPTVNGSLVFDERYLGKPLVYCGTGSVMPAVIAGRQSHLKAAEPGDRILMVGGRIGKDGIHGATFSSEALHQGSPSTAVQIGDPITQKRMTDFLLVCRDEGLYRSITDNGAGGLSSSVGEMAEGPGGARIDLVHAPLKYPGLAPWEVFLSEAQERMTVAVPPRDLARFMDLAREMKVEASDLGEFTKDGFLHVLFDGKTVARLEMAFLHRGLPRLDLKAEWKPPAVDPEEVPPVPAGLGEMLRRILARLNVCSKHYWVRQYDHEVQGGSVVKPLVGSACDGPSDAAVTRPVLTSPAGVVVSHGLCPRYGDLDPYDMAVCALDEAVRNAVAVGADPSRLAALDNFCWPDPVAGPSNPDGAYKLGQLVRTCQGLYDLCTAFRIPLISGKDSMKNDYKHEGIRISIPPTLLVTAIGIIPDVQLAVTMDLKSPGDSVYLIGMTRPDLGASEYYLELGVRGGRAPRLRDAEGTLETYLALHEAMKKGLVRSCHDLSDGGLAAAAAESAFAGGLGLRLDLGAAARDGLDRDDLVLFSETPARFLVSIPPDRSVEFERILGASASRIGDVTDSRRLVIVGLGGETVIDDPVDELKACWLRPLDL